MSENTKRIFDSPEEALSHDALIATIEHCPHDSSIEFVPNDLTNLGLQHGIDAIEMLSKTDMIDTSEMYTHNLEKLTFEMHYFSNISCIIRRKKQKKNIV